jgi:hypothetical protein
MIIVSDIKVQDFYSRFDGKPPFEHIMLFRNVIYVRDRTVINVRLQVPLVLPEEVPLTAFHLRLIDNDTSEEV